MALAAHLSVSFYMNVLREDVYCKFKADVLPGISRAVSRLVWSR